MSKAKKDIIVGFGGAAGDGVASVGMAVARMAARQGLRAFAYNSYQSVIRGGHSWLRLRAAHRQRHNHGDRLDLLIALNQDSLDRHLPEIAPGGVAIYNASKFKPSTEPPQGVSVIGLPCEDLSEHWRKLPILQNTIAVGAATHMLGLTLDQIDKIIADAFARKGDEIVKINTEAAKAGYEYAKGNLEPLSRKLTPTDESLALLTGNDALAMAGAVAGVKFYVAYPMSPATGVLHWMAAHGKELGICVRQVEDEISVINMAIGANHAGVRGMCATSGGGFALMTEAFGMAGMTETPLVVINVQRAGPSTGVPTKTEQSDLNQALGASQGEFPRLVVAPTDIEDAYRTIPDLWNLADRYQCPALVLSDLYISEGTFTVSPALFEEEVEIDRGEIITEASDGVDPSATFLRFKDTESGISPRPVPGVPGHIFVAATDEHDEDGVLVSDVYTDPTIRKKMVDKRARKMLGAVSQIPAPVLMGPQDAEVTLVGWGSTKGVISEAAERLRDEGITVNHLQIKWLVPLHSAAISEVMQGAKKTIFVENNSTGQLARHVRAETGLSAAGHIRKYDGEPFEPKHIVDGVKAVLGGDEVIDVLSTEPGWRTEHPEVVRGHATARAH
jgi:2-oxoglutarate ferredoxin oxidoreductase subunit alpha